MDGIESTLPDNSQNTDANFSDLNSSLNLEQKSYDQNGDYISINSPDKDALTESFISDKGDDLGSASSSVKDVQKQKVREERLRQFKERQEQEKQKKLQEFLEAQQRAEEQRKKYEEEKKKKIEELRRKESERHLTVEERRQKLENEDRERKLALLRKYAEKNAKLSEMRSTRSPTQGLYAFGSRTARSVPNTPIDPSRRVASQGTLLRHDHDIAEPSPSPPKPDRKTASACNLSARGFANNTKLEIVEEDVTDDLERGWSRPSSAASARDVSSGQLSRKSGHSKVMSASTSLISTVDGRETPSAVGTYKSDRYQPYEVRRRRPHSVAGRLPSYASPTVSSQIREGRDRRKSGGGVCCGAMCSRFRSASVVTPNRRGRSIEPKDRSSVTNSIDRLATPKNRGKSFDVHTPDSSTTSTEKRNTNNRPAMKQPALIGDSTPLRATSSPSSETKSSSPIPVNLKPYSKLNKSQSNTPKISPAKGPMKAVHLNLPLKDSKVANSEEPDHDLSSKNNDVGSDVKNDTTSDSNSGQSVLNTERGESPTENATSKGEIAKSSKEASKATSRSVMKDKSTTEKVKEPRNVTIQEKEDDTGKAQASVEEEYKAKLAEKRRLAREKAEQEAAEAKRLAEEKKREEEERLRQEEEERRRQEEEEIRLSEEAKLLEEERLKQAQEAQEIKRKQEEEKRIAEQKVKEEALRKAQEEKEKMEKEREEKLQKEEQERQSRKKRLDDIMKRVKTDEPASTKGDVLTSSRSINSLSAEQGLNGSGEGAQDSGKFKSPLLQQMMGNKTRSMQSNSPRSGSPQRAATDGVSSSLSDSVIVNHHTAVINQDSQPRTDEPVILNTVTVSDGTLETLSRDGDFLASYREASIAKTSSEDTVESLSQLDTSSFLSIIASDVSTADVTQTESAQWKSSQQLTDGKVNGVHSSSSHDSDTAFRSPRENGDQFEQLINVPDTVGVSKPPGMSSPIVAFEQNN